MRKWDLALGAEMGGPENWHCKGSDYKKQTKKKKTKTLKSVAAGAAQWSHRFMPLRIITKFKHSLIAFVQDDEMESLGIS